MPKLMHDLARYIETHSDKTLTLEALAQQVQLSPAHLQRRFKAEIGVTPKEYQESCRMQKFKVQLQQGQPISGALYEAGFGSPSRIYEKLDTQLGMTPAQYRNGGKGMEISYASAQTPLGLAMIGATDRGICFIQFDTTEDDLLATLKLEYPQATLHSMHNAYREQFCAWMQALRRYLDGQKASLDLPLDIRGTAFQTKVWKYLQTIPTGTTVSYGEAAKAIGHPKAIRAVASACANNTIAIAVPCHRVLRGNGDLAGYRWGIARKHALLQMEQKKAIR